MGSVNLYEVLQNRRVLLNNTTPFTPSYVYPRLKQGVDPSYIYANRIQGRQILLENPARVSRARQDLEKKKARKKAARGQQKWPPATSREGLWKRKDYKTRYDLFLPLHHLWLGYMSELLALHNQPTTPSGHSIPNAGVMHAKLVKADFHGSIITVCQSKNPCLVGLSGIVMYESENAFRIVTKADKLKLVPKQNSIFTFAVPLYSTPVSTGTDSGASSSSPLTAAETVFDRAHLEFELHGNHFRFRSTDRASRKFKPKETIEL